jgi:ElaB/YqjD/DUF883 family membrane-anchored ribosome-binding protein
LQAEIDELTEDCDKVLDAAGASSGGRVSQGSENSDLLREVADDLLRNAERCYRLARATLDFQARERLLDLAREFEEKAEAARVQPRR